MLPLMILSVVVLQYDTKFRILQECGQVAYFLVTLILRMQTLTKL